MSLLNTASRVYAEYGEEGLRRWEARLTSEQRLALVHDFDQFGAGLREVSAALQPLADQMTTFATRVAGAVDEIVAAYDE